MSAAAGGWWGGAASSTFPIPDGTPLAGYAAREGPARGTLDPLTIGALVLERDGARIVIVAADLAAVDAGLVDEITAAAGIERSELALCASHTHGGPAGVVARLHPAGPDGLIPALRARFVATAAATIAAARRARQPVDLLFGQVAAVGVAANRNDPALPADARLSVLATRRGDGSIQCAVAHFACHPTILGAANRAVAADFPGALRRQLAATLPRCDSMPIVLFVNGAAGDISTRFTRRAQDAAEVERLGGLLAQAADAALRAARPMDGPICHGSTSVSLTPRPCAPPNGDATTEPDAAEDAAASAVSPGLRRIAETRQQGAVMLAALAALPDGAVATRCDLEAWTIGDLVLVSVPGELFSSFGRQIDAVPDQTSLVLGYTNGSIGYLADRRAHEAGAYEALASPYGPEDGERVAVAAAALVSRIRTKRKGGEALV